MLGESIRDNCLSEVHGPRDSGKFWKKVNRFKRRTRAPEKPLTVDGQITRNALEKAEALATTFAKASQSQHLPEEAREHRRANERDVAAPAWNISAPHNSDLTGGDCSRHSVSSGPQARPQAGTRSLTKCSASCRWL